MPVMNDKETVKEYFIKLYIWTKLSKTSFANKLNVSQPAVSNILTGDRYVSSNLIKSVYNVFGINLETISEKSFKLFLINKYLSMKNNNNQSEPIFTIQYNHNNNDDNLITIPYYNVKAAAGSGIENFVGNADDVYYFDKRLLPRINTSNLSVITASGDSMDSGKGKSSDIKDGDLLIVNNNDIEPVDGNVYVLLVNNKDLRVKKIQLDYNGSFKIISNNPEYHTEIYNPESKNNKFSIKIIGKVLWNGSKGLVK